MAKTDFRSIDDYLASIPEEARPVLQRARAAIRKAVPAAEEVISYQMPAFKVPGATAFLYLGAWKKHYSLYPATEGVTAKFAKELADIEVEKGTIRFPYDRPVPVRLIAAMAKQRAAEEDATAAAKAAAKAAGTASAKKRATAKASRV